MDPNDSKQAESSPPTSSAAPSPPTFAFECAVCGAESDNEAAYQAVKGSRGGQELHCLPCTQLDAVRQHTANVRWVFGGALIALALVLLFPDSFFSRIGWAFINLGFLPLLLGVPTIVVHELGHWGAARALGLPVHGVQVGVGPLLWSGRWGDVQIHWRRHALLGRVFVALPDLAWPRSRFALMTAAGPTTHLLWMAGAFWVAGGFDPSGPGLPGLGSISDRPNLFVAIVWLNAFSLVLNLIPAKVGDTMTDGALLLAIPGFKAEQLEELVQARWATPAEMALHEGEWERAREILDEGLSSAPESLVLQLLDASYSGMIGEFERATLCLRALHAREGLEPVVRASIANGLAWSLCLSDDPGDLEEQVALVREAQRQLGEQPAVLSTRGAILIHAGRPSEAWSLLANALSKLDEGDNRASVLCNLARAEHRLGLSEQARERLVEARAASPSNALIERTERELSGPPPVEVPRPIPAAVSPRTIEIPIPSLSEPGPARTRIPRWLWLGVPACVLLWSCVPPYVEAILTMDVPYHDLARGEVSEQERANCESGLESLDRWEWLLSRLPERGTGWMNGREGREARAAHLHACAGDLERAQAILSRSVTRIMAAIGSTPLSVDIEEGGGHGWERYSAAIVAFEQSLSLVHVEDRLGNTSAATATLEQARGLAREIDEAWSDVPQFGYRSRVVQLEVKRLELLNGPEVALARVEQALNEMEGGFPDHERVNLMISQAELLERLGRGQEANSVWARVGRAGRSAAAMHETRI